MAPPFLNASGLVTKILDKIIEASLPERFTQDFLSTKLGFSGGSARPMISLLKKLGFLASDGTPTPLYSQFRNPENRGAAMYQGLRAAYKEIYDRNEFAHDLPKEKLKNLVVELTGMEPDNQSVGAIVSTFQNLKAYAKFDKLLGSGNGKISVIEKDDPPPPPPAQNPTGLNLSYTINLNLPETADVEVFNAIFRSLKENLLKV